MELSNHETLLLTSLVNRRRDVLKSLNVRLYEQMCKLGFEKETVSILSSGACQAAKQRFDLAEEFLAEGTICDNVEEHTRYVSQISSALEALLRDSL
ncbi:hypothetical protein BMI91_00090 [Thioclava sediminum]|uniref:Uncharacterized protein n=2 Tax=Thioclava sediminum TaxID=1915319 RepID=A0ABX3N1Z3_9RHOB|nr:hypothetical protein BMI91_00090 [Thioclava sediminum]